MFYNIHNNNTPTYLQDLVPNKIQSLTTYPLRNGEDIVMPFCRLSITRESFIPSTIKEWNKLDVSLRNVDSLAKFKTRIKPNKVNAHRVPLFYTSGPRKINIILTQLRCSASFLNYDLHKVNIIADPYCRCGCGIEDANHFFLICPLYQIQRTELLNNLEWIPDTIQIDTYLFLHGCSDFSDNNNQKLLNEICKFIKNSKRFLVVD